MVQYDCVDIVFVSVNIRSKCCLFLPAVKCNVFQLIVCVCVCCRVPLVVEVWHRDSTSRDQLIGQASIQLSHLLRSERSRLLASTGEQSWRQTHQDRIPVVKTHR